MSRHQTRTEQQLAVADLSALIVPDSIKMLRETFAVSQARIGNSPLDEGRKREHIDRLQRLIAMTVTGSGPTARTASTGTGTPRPAGCDR